MGTDKTIFVEVVRGGTTGSYVTGSDVSHVTGSDASHVTGKDRKYVLRMPDFPRVFLLNIVVVQNVSLRITDTATGSDRSSRDPEGGWKGVLVGHFHQK
jgi:hypothetical protein